MKWFLFGFVLVILYYFFILKKKGNIDFWKKAGKSPDLAYQLFKEEDCWLVFEDNHLSRNNLPPGEWDGPFRITVPMLGGKTITVYGKVPAYVQSQQRFMMNK